MRILIATPLLELDEVARVPIFAENFVQPQKQIFTIQNLLRVKVFWQKS